MWCLHQGQERGSEDRCRGWRLSPAYGGAGEPFEILHLHQVLKVQVLMMMAWEGALLGLGSQLNGWGAGFCVGPDGGISAGGTWERVGVQRGPTWAWSRMSRDRPSSGARLSKLLSDCQVPFGEASGSLVPWSSGSPLSFSSSGLAREDLGSLGPSDLWAGETRVGHFASERRKSTG
jgi:hypothetical protein